MMIGQDRDLGVGDRADHTMHGGTSALRPTDGSSWHHTIGFASFFLASTLNQVCHDGFLLASSILITGLLITAIGCLNEFHITRFTQTQPCVCAWISILWCFECSRLPPYQSRKACHGTGGAICCCRLVILNVCSCMGSFYI